MSQFRVASVGVRNINEQMLKAFASFWEDSRSFVKPFAFTVMALLTTYGLILIGEHLTSAAIQNHSLLNFTPQLTIGLLCLVLGAASCVGMFNHYLDNIWSD